jgi:hypothetical protein
MLLLALLKKPYYTTTCNIMRSPLGMENLAVVDNNTPIARA